MNLIKLHDNGDVSFPTALRKCADVLEKRGVAKGYLHVERSSEQNFRGYSQKIGSMCSVGVIHYVVGGDAQRWASEKTDPLMLAFEKVVSPFNFSKRNPGQGVVIWNNDPMRSAEEVIAGFRKAADVIEAQDKEAQATS